MPTLKKAVKPKSRNLNREERIKVYNSDKWRSLRLAYLMEHPLCEMCLEEGKVEPAIDVHHRDSYMNYSGNMRLFKAYDFNNLMSLCKECHAKLHINGRTYG